MKKRIIYIDVINIIAIFSVLMLHSSQYSYTNGQVLKNGIIQLIFIPAVYLFFMNSGAMLLDYRQKYSTKTFLIKRWKRVGIPLVAWSILWYLYDIRETAFPGPIPHHNPSISDFIVSFLNNNIINIFWFFYAIILLYLLTPVLAILADNHKKILCYLAGLGFVGGYLYPFIATLFKIKLIGGENGVQINPIASSFVSFFILGYLIKANYFSENFQRILMGAGITALLISICLNLLNFGKLAGNGLFIFFYATGIYLIIKKGAEKSDFLNKHATFVAKLASTSLGIYILHPLFYHLFEKIFKVSYTSFSYVWIMPVITYIICALLIYNAKKI
ncbi:acyltransferase [Fructilactobacillus florum]|uniref:acyltransferase n=1 Tax=Fructilactobacillus florum TaxID=640331 RepID=UPI0006D16DC7|nr:acyltransferase [Fructilactobacillus florum]